MKVQWVQWISAVAILVLAVLSGNTHAQMGPGAPMMYAPQPGAYGSPAAYGMAPGSMPPGPMAMPQGMPPGAMGMGAMGMGYGPPPGAMGAGYGPPPGAMGQSYMAPAGYTPSGFGGDGGMHMDSAGPTHMGGMAPMGGMGSMGGGYADGGCGDPNCTDCMGGYGRRPRLGGGLALILGWLLPYGEGGCCAPHWFDVHAEGVYMQLDDYRPAIDFSRDDSISQTVINSADLVPDREPGLRVTLTHQTGPGSNIEFTYFGLLESTTSKTVTGNASLLSVFSDFTDLNPPDGLEQFDLANLHRVDWSNDFNSLELNYRRRFIGPTCTIQGSWLVGIRYLDIREKLRFHSEAERDTDNDLVPDTGGVGDYNLGTSNYMTGGQLGGDVWICMLPGLNFGIEGKAALLGNNSGQQTTITGVDIYDNFIGILPGEKIKKDRVSYLGELSFMLNYRVNQSFTIRGGYELVYIDNVATAMDNFNPDIDALTPRTPYLDSSGALFYDGFALGLEYMW